MINNEWPDNKDHDKPIECEHHGVYWGHFILNVCVSIDTTSRQEAAYDSKRIREREIYHRGAHRGDINR